MEPTDVPPKEQLTLRATTIDEVEKVAAFLHEVQPHNPKGDPDTARWQWYDNPYGRVSSWVYATPDDRFLSHWMNFPMQGLIRGETVGVGKGGDGATLPAARGMGLASATARESYREIGELGCPYSFATVNTISVKTVAHSGVQVIGTLPLMIRPLDAEWMAERLPLPGAVSKVGAGAAKLVGFRPKTKAAGQRVDEVPADVQQLWDRAVAAEPTHCRIVHDEVWWRWRYAKPRTDYQFWERRVDGRLDALAAVLIREAFDAPVLHVLDVLATDADAGSAVVQAATEANADKVVAVAGIGVEGTMLDTMQRSVGMRHVPLRMQPRPIYMGFASNVDGAPDVTGESWTISWIDFDHL